MAAIDTLERMPKAVKRAGVLSRLWFVWPGMIGLFIVLALFAGMITPYSPNQPVLPDRLLPPIWQEGGGWTHPLGTDNLGRDMLTRVIYGARVSLAVAFVAIVLGAGIGTIIGIVSGFLGGWVDVVLMRLTDVTLSLEISIMGLVAAAVWGPSFRILIIVVTMVLWARWARVIRGEVLSLKERDFVAMARVTGCSNLRIIVRHLFPNVFNIVVVLATLQVGWIILVEAALSFIGAGIPPPTPAWGRMAAEGREYLVSGWWVSFFPGFAIMLTVLSFNLFGDWLRDRLDPKLRQI